MRHCSNQEAFECYRTYLALKRHFTTDYDFFKYNGKVKTSVYAFEKRPDRFQFQRLAKRSDWKELLLANVVDNPSVWIGDLSEDLLIEMKKRRGALLYNYQQDLKRLAPTFNANFEVFDDSAHPYLLERFIAKDVSIDTVVILKRLVNFLPHWDKKIKETVIWPKYRLLLTKYEPFLDVDLSKFKKKTVDYFR